MQFKQIIAIPGSVPVPQPGKKVETQTVSGSTLWLSADHSGRVTVISPDSSNVAILKPTLNPNYKESMQTAVNLQSCVGLVHIVAEVRKASEGGIDVLDSHVATKARPSWFPAAVDKSQWTSLHVGRARRLLSHALQQEGAPSVMVGVRSLLEAVDPLISPGPNPDVTSAFPDPESPPTPNPEDAANATAPEKVNPNEGDGDGAVAVSPAVSSTANADAPAAAVPDAAPPVAAGTTALEATENSALPEKRPSSGRGNNSTIIIVIAVACAALLLAALVVCAAILRRRKKNSERGGPSKSLSMGNRGVMYQQESHFGGSYTNSMALRHAQAPVPMVCMPECSNTTVAVCACWFFVNFSTSFVMSSLLCKCFQLIPIHPSTSMGSGTVFRNPGIGIRCHDFADSHFHAQPMPELHLHQCGNMLRFHMEAVCSLHSVHL